MLVEFAVAGPEDDIAPRISQRQTGQGLQADHRGSARQNTDPETYIPIAYACC